MRRYARKCKVEKKKIVDATRSMKTTSYKVYDLRSRRRKRRNDHNAVSSPASYRAETTMTLKDDNECACLSSSLQVPTLSLSSCLLSDKVVTASSLCSNNDSLNKCDSTTSAISPHPQVESYGKAPMKFVDGDGNKPPSCNSPSPHVISMESVSTNVKNSGAFETKQQSEMDGKPNMRPSEYEIEEFFSNAEKQLQKQFSDKYNFDVVKDVPLEGRYEWVQIKP